MERKKASLYEKITGCVIAAACVIFAAALLILPKQDWSENENRTLAAFPELTLSGLAQGEYLSDVEEYLTDHFPARDVFVSINTRVSVALGRRELNGVYIGSDGFLIDRYEKPQRTEKILEGFNRLVQAAGERSVTLLLAPTAAEIYSDRLPPFANCADQSETMARFRDGFEGTFVDVAPVLHAHRDERQLYYRTDHHWTTWGAYYACTELCAAMGMRPVPAEQYEITQVTEDFRGTTFSKLNDLTIPGEPIYRFTLPGQQLTVSYGMPDRAVTSEAQGSDGLYNPEYLGRKDKYSYFLDNIHEFITVENPDADTSRQLVMIKDSYANCMVPFLAQHFEKMYIIDPRYYRDSIIDFVTSDDAVTDVLILYNLGTMDNDTGVTAIF